MTVDADRTSSSGALAHPRSTQPVGTLNANLFTITHPDEFRRHAAETAHSVFQGGHWLATWAAALSCRGVDGLFWVTIRDASGEPVLGMPLVLRREGHLRLLEMPDCGISDYLGPVIHPRGWSRSSAPALRDFWPALSAVLPPADLLRFEGLKAEIAGYTNPFFHHWLAQPSRQCGWKLALPERWEDYLGLLSPRMREKLAKARRRFLRQPGADMQIARSGAQALDWLGHLDRMQRERLAVTGRDLRITNAEFSDFYRALAAGGIETGEVVMTGLFAQDEVVALNYAVRTGNRATYLRLANAFGPWAPMCPGLLATENIIRHLHEAGVRIFDFGLGDYDYKRRFGGQPYPLHDLDLPLSARGLPAAALAYARRALRNQTWLRRLTGRAELGKPVDRCEP